MSNRTFENITAKHTMNRVKSPHMPFSWSINPYRGCTHGCSFCYARATHKFLDMQADDSFQNHIFIKENAAEALETQLTKLAKKYLWNIKEMVREMGFVAIGTATDPYQPIEGKSKQTRDCLKVLARYQIPTSITTRSPLILRDLDLLKDMHITSINVSINTLDSKIRRNLEPGASYPKKRLQVVQQLVDSGLNAGIFIAPILPCLTDSLSNLEWLISAAKQHQAQFAVPSVLRLGPEVKDWFFHSLEQFYPHLLSAYKRLYKGTYPNKAYVDTLMGNIHGLMDKHDLTGIIPSSRYHWDHAREQELAQSLESQHHLGFSAGAEQLSFSF